MTSFNAATASFASHPRTRLRGGYFEPEHSIPITCSLKILFVSLIDCHLYEKFTTQQPSIRKAWWISVRPSQFSHWESVCCTEKYPFTNYAVRSPTLKESVFKGVDLTSTIHVKITRHSLALLTPLSSERQITLRWYWLPLRWPKHQSLLPTTDPLRTTLTRTIRL